MLREGARGCVALACLANAHMASFQRLAVTLARRRDANERYTLNIGEPLRQSRRSKAKEEIGTSEKVRVENVTRGRRNTNNAREEKKKQHAFFK